MYHSFNHFICILSIKIDLYVCLFLINETGDAGQGMTITLHADLDLFQDLCRHVMGEVIGRSGTPRGVLDPFPGLFLRVMRGITGQTAGPQARERMVKVPLTRGIVNRAGHQIQGENPGVPQSMVLDPTGMYGYRLPKSWSCSIS